MPAGRPRMPDAAVVVRNLKATRPLAPGELTIISDIRSRIAQPGASKRVSFNTGISRSHLLSIANGNARVGQKTARRLGYQPAWERMLVDQAALEDHLLANKVEAELHRPSLLKERDE